METGKKVSKTMPRAKSSRLYFCDCMIENINLNDSFLKRFYSYSLISPYDRSELRLVKLNVCVINMAEGIWKEEVKGLSFERFPKLEKVGNLVVRFTDEGNVVPARTTG